MSSFVKTVKLQGFTLLIKDDIFGLYLKLVLNLS